MEPSDLPEPLREIEARLASRPGIEPPSHLRQRILAEVRRNLAAPVRPRLSLWEFAAALAAAVLVAMNLSMAAASQTALSLPSGPGNGIDEAVAAVRQLVPDMPEAEARRQVVLLKAGSRLVPAPVLRPSLGPRGFEDGVRPPLSARPRTS